MFAIEHTHTSPDILISAKGLANGFPLSMILSRKELMDRQPPGSMGGTYAGNAVSCAAASAVLDVFREEKILDNVAQRSEQIFGFLRALQADRSSKAGRAIQDVRGHGLMVGVQFSHAQGEEVDPIAQSGSDNVAAAAHSGMYEVDAPTRKQIAPQVVAECQKRHMLLLSTSTQDVLRFIPPLNISEQDLAKACQIFKESLEAVVGK